MGVDVGGSRVKVVCVAAGTEEVLRRTARPTGDGQHGSGVPNWAAAVRDAVAEFEGELGSVSGIGVSAPGLAADDGRSIACMPGRMEGIVGFDWTEFLGRGWPVPVLNDAQAALLGEMSAGAARGRRNVYLLTLGTGVGGAACVDGRILRGAIGRAGHLGHICLDPDGALDITRTPGSLEDLIGEHTVRVRSAGRFLTTRELVAAYAAGDRVAGEVWRRSVRVLACAIASLNNVLDSELVVLGGGIASAGPLLFEPLARELDEVEWRPLGRGVPVVQAELGEWAGAVGAAFCARDSAESRP